MSSTTRILAVVNLCGEIAGTASALLSIETSPAGLLKLPLVPTFSRGKKKRKRYEDSWVNLHLFLSHMLSLQWHANHLFQWTQFPFTSPCAQKERGLFVDQQRNDDGQMPCIKVKIHFTVTLNWWKLRDFNFLHGGHCCSRPRSNVSCETQGTRSRF